MEGVTKERSEVAASDTWNVGDLYPNWEAWEKELKAICHPDQKPHWPEIGKFRGRLGEGAKLLKEYMDVSFSIQRGCAKLYTYAHLRHDEDVGHDLHKGAYMRISALFHDLSQEDSWGSPEILALPEATLAAYLKDPILQEYHFCLSQLIRLRPHTLSAEMEQLVALAGKALGTPSKAFSVLNNADLVFPAVEDGEGKLRELTHAKYMGYMKGKDRTLRKNAFQTLHRTFEGFANTLCELINGQVQQHLFHAKSRKYSSCLQAALFPNQIDTAVYTNLIETVRKNLPILHRYTRLRKKALGVEELHLYDLYVPLLEEVDMKFSYDEAMAITVESVAPLGKEYQEILKKGLGEKRWVDRYENKRKRSGAYSSGCYDSMPYILMNFQGHFHDLMTLAHEAGHSMHSYLSHTHQPYQYSHYPIFLAEVASTFNEELVFKTLMERGLSPKEEAFLINQKIEDLRGTLIRQTMFAEFELLIHTLAEQDIPLTPSMLKEKYRQLNSDYFGVDVVIDSEIDIEWARIPHFYYNFYVYQYATGISSAHALFEKVIKEKDPARKAYLKFLSSGSSKYPLDLLQEAGVNMREKHPIESTLRHFDELVGRLGKLL